MTHVTTDVSTDLDGHITDRLPTSRSKGEDTSGEGERANGPRSQTRRGLTPVGRALGWFSVGLGLCQLLAPKRLARMIGLSSRPRTLLLMRALGARELTTGIGLLTRRRRSVPWLWARVAGDIVDLGLLSSVMWSPKADRMRVGGALAAVAGVSLLDAWAGQRAGREEETAARQPIRRSITIARSPAEVYRFWRDFQNLPKFMVHLESVETLDSKRSYWRARSVGGKTFEWNAEIVDDCENELISWRTVGGSEVAHAGVVRFLAAPGGRGTEIHVQATYDPPGGAFARAIALTVGREPSQQVEGDLRRLKQVLEVGEVVESDASLNRGMHPARPSVAPRVRKRGGQS
jgi:uncharacterized membrane protein